MITVYKYPVPIQDEFTIEMPAWYRLISVQSQRDMVYLWAMVDTDVPATKLRFILKGTGHPFTEAQAEMANEMDPVGTFQLFDGDLVFHLFLDVT